MSAKRAVAIVAAVVLGAIGGSYFYAGVLAGRQQDQARVLAVQVTKLQTAILSMCGSSADIGSAPVLPPGGGAPSKLAIQLVTDERHQWRKLRCPGTLPAQPGYRHWAAVYHIPPQ